MLMMSELHEGRDEPKIMAEGSRRLPRHRKADWLLQTEFEQRLAGHRYLLAFGSCGCRSTGYSAYPRADGSALSPARDSTNERSESRAANDFLSGLTTLTL
jgi:hypothetical protein